MCPYVETLSVLPYIENLVVSIHARRKGVHTQHWCTLVWVFYDGMVTGGWYGHIGVHKLCLCTPTRFFTLVYIGAIGAYKVFQSIWGTKLLNDYNDNII